MNKYNNKGTNRRRLLQTIPILAISGCIGDTEKSNNGTTDSASSTNESGKGGTNGDNKSRTTDERPPKEKASLVRINAYLIESVPDDTNCLAPDEPPIDGTDLLARLQSDLKKAPPSDWPEIESQKYAREISLSIISRGNENYKQIVSRLESLPQAYDGKPCIEFEDYTIAISWSFSWPE